MNDLTLFFITIFAIVVSFGVLFLMSRAGQNVHKRLRDIGGTAMIFSLLIEVTLVFILGEHFLEQFKSH